jgi:hypothetical protein
LKKEKKKKKMNDGEKSESHVSSQKRNQQSAKDKFVVHYVNGKDSLLVSNAKPSSIIVP